MYRFVIAALLGLVVAGGRLAHAAPATLFDNLCPLQNLDGSCICLRGSLVVTQPVSLGTIVGTGPWILHCEGDLGRRLPHVFRFEDVCGVTLGDGTVYRGRLFVLDTPSGRAMYDCMVQLF